MRIGALQKTTLLDFPGRVSAIVFTQGCNFMCPCCHNPDLLPQGEGRFSRREVTEFLERRRKLLQGVVITGGEPTLQEALEDFCRALKDLGYAVKLDTNGSRPDVLHSLLRRDLLDYVAVDVKAHPLRYPRTLSLADVGEAVRASIAVLGQSPIHHEFRVPCLKPFVDEEAFQAILELTDDSTAPVFLQQIRTEHVLNPDFFRAEGRPLTFPEIETLKKQADRRGRSCVIR